MVAHKGYAIKAPPSPRCGTQRFLPGRKSSKINSFVEFPATLDLFQFLSEEAEGGEEEGLTAPRAKRCSFMREAQ